MKNIFPLGTVLLLFFTAISNAQYPATLRVPATFYDFHSDDSNPDFEPGVHSCGSTGCINGVTGLHLNEVRDTLDAQRKPVLGTTPYFSDMVY